MNCYYRKTLEILQKLLELLRLVKSSKSYLTQVNVNGSVSRNPNPYMLIWYRSDWSMTKIKKNNTNYWEWEIVHNGFKCP